MANSSRRLSDVADLMSGGTPAKSDPLFWGGSIPWLTPKDMALFDGETTDTVTDAAIGNGTRLAPPGASFIAVRGMSLHNEIRILRIDTPITFNQDIKAIIPRDIDSRFLYYALCNQRSYLLAAVEAAGHGTGRLPTDKLAALQIPIFESAEQQAIAHVLGSLDDKIALNRRMNETLEAMGRALFQDWFVDFGPVRAKMAGHEPPGLSAEIAALFPERLDSTGKPEGWRLSQIGNEVTVVGGATPSTKEAAFWEGGTYYWATPKDLSALTAPVLLSTERQITDAGLGQISSRLLPIDTVLLSSRAPIGYLAITAVPTAINQGFIGLICDQLLPSTFVLFWCQAHMETIIGNANGSTFQEISKGNFRPIPVSVPPESIIEAFTHLVNPLFGRIVENLKEERLLAELRDTLLPRLLSGELRVEDVDSAMQEG
jgi:type I restriction enzyme, S subunit